MNRIPTRAFALHRPLVLALMALLVAGCASGPKKRIFPPTASLQELRVQDSGVWSVQLRLQNFSTVAMQFDRIDAELSIEGLDAGRVQSVLDRSVPPNSAEIVELELTPETGAREAVAGALESRRSLSYRLQGRLLTVEPASRDDDFEFKSTLTPMPGLEGVLR